MIISKIDSTVKKYDMLKSGETVAVGVSGGADSMLLLNYLNDNKKRYGIKIIAANVEHGIRGEESKADTEFVKEFCKKKGIELKCLSINAPEGAAEEKLGVEEYSRNKRYEFFASLGADKIATAHNMTDNAETLLFRLSRGTSVKGAASIPPVRDNIIRPLIECTSKEIRDYCKANSIPFVVDKTNFDNDYSRNYIRNVILPCFEKLNPSYEEAFSRFISSAAEDEECISSLAKAYSFPVSVERIKNVYPSVQKRVFTMYAAEFGITLDEIHLNEVVSLIGKTGKTQLKGDIFAVNDGELISISKIENNTAEPEFITEKRIISKEEFLKNCEILKKEFAFYCDCDKISGNIDIRQRLSGDSISLADRNITKSLKKLMNELKIPAALRDNTAVICDEKGVIGVYGYSLGERVKIDKNTKRVCLLKISVEDNN